MQDARHPSLHLSPALCLLHPHRSRRDLLTKPLTILLSSSRILTRMRARESTAKPVHSDLMYRTFAVSLLMHAASMDLEAKTAGDLPADGYRLTADVRPDLPQTAWLPAQFNDTNADN